MGQVLLAEKFEIFVHVIMLSKVDTVTFPIWKIILHIALIIIILYFARRHRARREEKYLRELIEASQKRFLAKRRREKL